MAVPSKACHLISFLLVLTTASANRRLLRDELVCIHSTDDDCPKLAGGGSRDPGLVDNVCYPCVGVANNNLGDIVIGLPGINIAGIGIRFPAISIGNYGVQIGGFGGAVGYMPGFRSSVCCDPSRGNEYMPTAPLGGWSCGGVPLEPDGRVGIPMGPGFGHQSHDMGSPQIPNMMKRQEETPKGRNEQNKHVVKPKMGMGGQASVQRWRNKDNKYVVKPKMETGEQENMGIKHVVKPKMEIRMRERGDKFVVKPKPQMAEESNANNHGDEYKKAHVSVHAMPPMSN